MKTELLIRHSQKLTREVLKIDLIFFFFLNHSFGRSVFAKFTFLKIDVYFIFLWSHYWFTDFFTNMGKHGHHDIVYIILACHFLITVRAADFVLAQSHRLSRFSTCTLQTGKNHSSSCVLLCRKVGKWSTFSRKCLGKRRECYNYTADEKSSSC